jgi:pimeloyl-ACP methyl ester carboxylesterase
MQELFRDAQAHQLIAAGHQLLVERPAEVAAIVAEFLYEEQPQAAQ